MKVISTQKSKAYEILSNLVEKKFIIKNGQGRSTHYILEDIKND